MTKRHRITIRLLVTILCILAGTVLTVAPVVARPTVAAHPPAAPGPMPQVQSYSFAVPELLMDVTVQSDGSALIVYDITFENYGSPIDIVDIGTPNSDYVLGEITAAIDGQPLTEIRPSTYIDTGIEVHLGPYAIPSGERGTLHVEFISPDMVYADTTNEELASLQITPTWFESDLVEGSSNIEIRVRMLPGIESDEVLYQDEPFTNKYVGDGGRVLAVWRYEGVRLTDPYRVGVSFPRRGVSQVIEVTFWDLLGQWLGRLTPFLFSCLPIAFIFLVMFLVVRGIVRASKPNYLPPIAQTEGGGIKRGLTAPESAVVLELPLTKVLGLVIFGMLEKGLVTQTDPDPLTVEVAEDFRVADRPQLNTDESRRDFRRRAAQQAGTVIHRYEHAFLDLIEAHPDEPIKELDVVTPMQKLVDGVADKMAGFDLSDTQDYYRRVIDRAMEQAAALGEIEQREAYLDKYLPWIMMRRDYRPVLSTGGYHYWPVWARQTRTGSVGSGGRSTSGRSGGGSSTTFGDVSASFAGWAETTMGGMAAAILPTSLSKPSPVRSSSGGSGGSSCACACAGCACACACAGGGR